MNDESRAKLIMSIHKLFGAPISEARKAYNLIIEYFTLKSNMGDHPEECKPREYILVEKKISDDAINRQDAIRIAEHGQVQGYEWQFKQLNKLPPVTPKQKTGYWIILSSTDMCCSECNEIEHLDTSRKFCAYCGTKMQGVKEWLKID